MIKAFGAALAQTKKFQKIPVFFFGNAVSNLKSIIQKEIDFESKNTPSTNEFIDFFKNNGWKISYAGTQVELEKKNGEYLIRLLFNARSPPTQTQEQSKQQEQQQQEEDDTDYSEISVYIQKNGDKKWMCSEMFVTGQQSQIAGVRFLQNYENQKVDRLRERSSNAYLGPEIDSLEESLQEHLKGFIENVGVDQPLLTNVFNYSVVYEHQFYVQWLKDFNSLL